MISVIQPKENKVKILYKMSQNNQTSNFILQMQKQNAVLSMHTLIL